MALLVKAFVYLSTDGPYVASPTWNDITAFVDCDANGIKLGRGRPDTFSTTTAGTCSFTLSNQDGRFTQGNSGSPYYPNLRLNNRIKVTVSNNGGAEVVRFMGYINEWPNDWVGKLATSTVSCTDVFKILEQSSDSRGNYSEAAVKDMPVAWYPLDEEAPAVTFGCTNLSGSVNPVASSLNLIRMVASQITGDERVSSPVLNTSSIDYGDQNGAPDSSGGIKFNPLPTSNHAGGYMLQGNLPQAFPTDWVVEFWCYATTVATNASYPVDTSVMVSFNATTRLASSLNIAVDASTGGGGGNIMLAQEKGSTSAFTGVYTRYSDAKAYITDGRIHMITVEYTSATHTTNLYVDGVSLGTTTNHTWPTGLKLLTVGGRDDRAIYPKITSTNDTLKRLNTFQGTLSNVLVFNRTASTYEAPSVRYAAGTGWANLGDFTGDRIKRLLGLAGMPSAMYTVATGQQKVGSQFTKDSSLLAAAQADAQVEDMPLFVDSDGLVHFDDRSVRNAPTFTSIDSVEFNDVSFKYDDTFLVNVIDVQGTYIGKQSLKNFDGGTSVANFGTYRKSLVGLPFFSDSQVFNLARRWLTKYANPPKRIGSLVIENAALLGSYATILGLEPNSGLRLTNLNTYYPGFGFGATFDTIIEGIDELIKANVHEFTFNCTTLTAADPGETDSGDEAIWQLGVTGHNELGTNTILDF